MTQNDTIETQTAERQGILDSILQSKAKKRLIVAGAGTGKTFTFSKILSENPGGENIAMTFIRLLRDDMRDSLGGWAEVRTFHEFCKKILHENKGSILLYPKLTKVIEGDATYLEVELSDFDKKFQQLDEQAEEIAFYIRRGDYYKTVAFNDSVYRMYLELRDNLDIVDRFDQILIDEFQDFNPLEVAFINELEKKGPIMIVGDDDQAVYDRRGSSPDHLRSKFGSDDYATFELPYCSRCTEVIVNATNQIIQGAMANGNLNGRIEKRYECFLGDKGPDNENYPYVVTAHVSVMSTLLKFISKEISNITKDEIALSWTEESEYPTVLIVGSKLYLNYLCKNLKEDYSNVHYKQTESSDVTISDAYKFLVPDFQSNIGWRILIDFILPKPDVQEIIKLSEDGTPIHDLLESELVQKQDKVVDLIKGLGEDDELDLLIAEDLKDHFSEEIVNEIVSRFTVSDEDEIEPDKEVPSIMLTSFQGCKGLSAGFVFVVGANDGVIPKDPNAITDVEVGQFIVALTRARKKCYIISQDWAYGPKDKSGKWIPKGLLSSIAQWIQPDLLEDKGNIKAADLR